VARAAHTAARDGRRARRAAREATAERLLGTAARHTLDPDVEVPWDDDPDPDLYWVPPEVCSLYGTGLWDRLTEAQRVELSRHEFVSVASTGVWFELILMQLLVRQLYRSPLGTAHLRFGLTEIADECRHSAMFSRLAAVTGATGYGPSPRVRRLGTLARTTGSAAFAFGGALYVEELLDGLQRLALKDQRVQPLTRAVCRVHVVEEARHIRFAREELRLRAPRLTGWRRHLVRLELGIMALCATRSLVDPQVYARVGIDPADGRRAAEANPHWRQARRDAAAKAVALLDELGLVAGPARLLWRRAGVLPG
jgi:hypothetical protein